MSTRRGFLRKSSLAAAAVAFRRRPFLGASTGPLSGFSDALKEIEKNSSGRLGVSFLDTRSGEAGGLRSTERFAMCSTFKMLLAAAVLERVDRGQEHLERLVAIPASGFLANSPITQEHAGERMSIEELAAAIVTRSDNTAANLLLSCARGPAGLTGFARSIGDGVTRLDRFELSLNEARPGDLRDTTSPEAMVSNLKKLLLGAELSPPSRERLTGWLIANKTGDERLRAGLPRSWRVGDKTGSNGENTTNDIAIIWPGDRAPVLLAVYLTECPGPETKRNSVLAQVAKLAATYVRSA